MPQRADYHDYDVLEHSLRSVLYAPKEIRLAMLFHDVGKPYCMQNFGEYHRHDLYGERIAKDILNRLKVSNKQKEEVLFIARHHMLDLKREMREVKVRRFIVKNYPFIPKLLLAKQADFSACKDDLSIAPTVQRWQGIIEKMKEEKLPFSIKELAVNGEDLIKAGVPKKQIGKTLQNLLDLVVGGEKQNEKQTLLSYINRKNP